MNIDFLFYFFGKATLTNYWRIKHIENIHVLNYVIDGRASYRFKGTTYFMEPGHVYLMPYSAKCERSLIKDVSFHHLYFDFTSVALTRLDTVIDIDTSSNLGIKYLFDSLTDFFVSTGGENGHWRHTVANKNYDDYLGIFTDYFKLILDLIDRCHRLSVSHEARVAKAINYIYSHYSEDVTVQALADMVYLEKHYFIKLFKRETGIPPHSFMKNYRLNTSISLLRTGASVSEVALLCGYKSCAAFSSAFKNYFNIYPSEISYDM